MSDSVCAEDEGLEREIGVRALGISIVNLVVGGGIFVLPGLIAVRLGPAAIVAYLVCSLTVGLVFLCFAEIGSRITRLAVVNIIGVKSGVRLLVFNTMAKLVPLVLLLAVGLFAINFDNLAITEWPSFTSIGAAAVVLFFAFAGAESGLSVSGEIKNPSKTVPMGLLVGLTGILALYVGLQTVAQGVLGAELANNTEAPLAAVATAVFGEWGAKMLLVAGVISIYSTVSGDMLSAPRVVFASARDNNLPKFLATVHPKYKTPYVSVIFFAAVVCAFALSGTFKPLAVLASGSLLVIYGGVSLAVIRLRYRDGEPGAGQFKLPFGATIPVLSCLVVGWLLSQLTAEEATGLAALIGASVLVYAIRIISRRVQGGKES